MPKKHVLVSFLRKLGWSEGVDRIRSTSFHPQTTNFKVGYDEAVVVETNGEVVRSDFLIAVSMSVQVAK